MADGQAPTNQPQSLVELIDSLLALVSRLRRPNFLPPEQFAKLTEIDARIGAECQLRSIEIPRLDDPKSDVHYFGATRLPYAVRTRGGIIVATSTNWEQSMRVLRLVAEKSASSTPPSANNQKFFPRGVLNNPDILELAARLNAAEGSGISKNQIAREFTGEPLENEPKAKSLLSQIRRLIRQGRLNI